MARWGISPPTATARSPRAARGGKGDVVKRTKRKKAFITREKKGASGIL